MQAFWIIVFLASLMVGFLMSGMEAGFFALSRLRIRHLMRAGNPRAKMLSQYLEKPEEFLWTILVGNTLANFVAVSLGVIGLHRWLAPWPGWFLAALLLAATIFYSFGELLPKMIFRLYPNRLCLWLALPFRLVDVALRPVVRPMAWLANGLLRWRGGRRFTGRLFSTRQELQHLMQESARGMSREERTLIQRVLTFQNLTLRRIVVPMDRVAAAHAQTPVAELLRICRERGFSRLPIWNRAQPPARIAGLVNLNRLLYQPALDWGKTAGDCMKPALFLEADLRLETALRQMQRTGQRLAIVVDTDRTELGVVSLQDVLKVIFGEVTL